MSSCFTSTGPLLCQRCIFSFWRAFSILVSVSKLRGRFLPFQRPLEWPNLVAFCSAVRSPFRVRGRKNRYEKLLSNLLYISKYRYKYIKLHLPNGCIHTARSSTSCVCITVTFLSMCITKENTVFQLYFLYICIVIQRCNVVVSGKNWSVFCGLLDLKVPARLSFFGLEKNVKKQDKK